MDIHHAMVVHAQPTQLYDALTQPQALEGWLGAPTVAHPVVGSVIDVQFDQGQRILKLEITDLQDEKRVQWRVMQPVWPSVASTQIITWTLQLWAGSTVVDFRMDGWPQDDDIYASVSYKWASFMVRLKFALGDTRELATLFPITPQGGTDNK